LILTKKDINAQPGMMTFFSPTTKAWISDACLLNKWRVFLSPVKQEHLQRRSSFVQSRRKAISLSAINPMDLFSRFTQINSLIISASQKGISHVFKAAAVSLSLCFSTLALATDGTLVQVVSVTDGDTFKITWPHFPALLGKDIPVRIYGIDAPEIHSHNICEQKKAEEAKQFLTHLLTTSKRVVLTHSKRDKYFRILSEVEADGTNVGPLLIERNLAYAYFGEKKSTKDWCSEENARERLNAYKFRGSGVNKNL
jgi:micrococcal nuclease